MTNGARRVVVTGLGIIAPNGNGTRNFEMALRKGQSGIRYQAIMEEKKFGCHVAGTPQGVDELAEARTSPASTSASGRP